MPSSAILIRCAVALFLIAPAFAQDAAPPFTLAWTKGVCRACKTASSLSDVQFVGGREAWAIGYRPPGETGFGDYAVLHSRDGGRIWREIPEPWQHNESPILSFTSRNEGWLKDIDVIAAEARLLWTGDGGAHWRRLPMRDLFIDQVQYLGAGAGYGAAFDPYAKQGYLVATADHGAHWRQSPLPNGFSTGLMSFADIAHGALAGCVGDRTTVIRTADGGAHWQAGALDLPPMPDVTGNCAFAPDSFGFLDPDHGWILVSKHAFALNDHDGYAAAWTTADGGATWRRVLGAHFAEDGESFGGLLFLDPQFGVLWKSRTVHGQTKGVLLYTTDAGQHWSSVDLPRDVWACRPEGTGLACAAGGDGFWVLHIARAAAPARISP